MAKISKTELIKLQKALQTDSAIGKKFGVTRQAVHLLRKKYGIPPVQHKNEGRNAQILSLREKGFSGKSIAGKIGLSVTHIEKIIRTSKKSKRKHN